MKKIWKEFASRAKLPFVATFVIGFLTHFYMLTNNYPNWDSVTSYVSGAYYTHVGRWFMSPVSKISTVYQMPAVNGVLALIYIALAMVLLIDIFEIQSKIVIVVICGVTVTFPVVASSMSWVYLTDGFLAAFFLAVLAVWLIRKFGVKGVFPGGIALCLSLGIYQAYASVALALILLVLLLEAVSSDIKKVLQQMLLYVCMAVLGAILYLVILKIYLNNTGIQLSSYQGVSDLGNMSIIGMLKNIPGTYWPFLSEIRHGSEFSLTKWKLMATLVLIVITGMMCLYLLIKKKADRAQKFFDVVYCLLLMLALPPVCNLAMLISDATSYSMVMKMSYLIILWTPLVLIERIIVMDLGRYVKVGSLAKAVILLSSVYIMFGNYLEDNVAYLNTELRYEKAYGLCNRIAARIESLPEYNANKISNVYVSLVDRGVGEESAGNTSLTDSYAGDISGTNGSVILTNEQTYVQFLNEHLGFHLERVDNDRKEEILSSEEYEGMDVWPADSSVLVIEDTIVIKIHRGY